MSQLQYMHKKWGPSECIIHVPRRLFFGSFFLLCPRNCLFMYLLSYYHRYLFIYLFIYWAWLSLWFQCKLAFGIKTNIWMNFLCGVHLVSFDIHFFVWYIFHSPINYFTDWYLQRKSHAESWPQKGTVWQRYFIFCFVTIFSVRVRLW